LRLEHTIIIRLLIRILEPKVREEVQTIVEELAPTETPAVISGVVTQLCELLIHTKTPVLTRATPITINHPAATDMRAPQQASLSSKSEFNPARPRTDTSRTGFVEQPIPLQAYRGTHFVAPVKRHNTAEGIPRPASSPPNFGESEQGMRTTGAV
jgi:hypothetical protein